MTDDRNNDSTTAPTSDLSRRDFVAVSIAATLAAGANTALAADAPLVEKLVEIKTPDGTCDAMFIHPATGAHPGVLVWPDAFGLRPSMIDIGKRVAAAGYSVLVPNPFYRVKPATMKHGSDLMLMPIIEDVPHFSFADNRATIQPLMASVNAPGAAEKDATAFIGWLDMQPQVDKSKKMGTQGYCMGGPLVVKTAATMPDRVGAGASFHGGGLVTNDANSPHLLAPKIKGRMYFGIASNDDMRQPDAKDKLKEAFAAAKVPAEIEVYQSSLHGWCVPDMPAGDGGMPIYNKPDAERAWGKLEALYKKLV